MFRHIETARKWDAGKTTNRNSSILLVKKTLGVMSAVVQEVLLDRYTRKKKVRLGLVKY